MGNNITQAELAEATGLSLNTYRRLERGELRLAPLAYYVNCALAIGVQLADVLDETDLEWTVLDASSARQVPAPGWWRIEKPMPGWE